MPTRKIYTNTVAQIAGKILTALISIAMIKILTTYLDIEGYGLYSKIYNYLSIFAVIADLGLYTITVRELSAHAEDRAMIRKISGNVLSLRTLSGVIIVFLSLFIGLFLGGYDSPEALIGIGIAGLFTLAGLVNSSLMSYLQATLRTEFSIVANTSGKLLTFGIILMFTIFFASVAHTEKFTLVMLAGLAGNILMMALTWWYVNKYERVRFAWDSTYIRHIIGISLPYWLALFLNVIFFKVDTILLSLMSPRSLADTVVALYALPMKIVEVGMMYGTIFLNSLLPVLTKAIEKNEIQKIYHLTAHAWKLLLFFGVGIATFSFALAPDIIRIISSREYLDTVVFWGTSVEAMQIVVWIFLFYFLSSLFTLTLIARSEQKKMLMINLVIAILNIIGNIIIIPYYSFIGSAWVTLISQVCLLVVTGIVARHNIRFRQVLPMSLGIFSFALFWLLVIGYIFWQEARFIPEWGSIEDSLSRICILGSIFTLIYGGWVGSIFLYRNKKKIRQ